jgi:S-adenosyl methyltransferase
LGLLAGRQGELEGLGLGQLPTAQNVHKIAQRVEPATRVVYLDDDPIMLSHAKALLADDKVTFVADGDLRDPVPPPCPADGLRGGRAEAIGGTTARSA